MTKYEQKLQQLINRRIDPHIESRTKLASIHEDIDGSPSVRYAITAMRPVDPAYTEETFRQGARIRNQIEKELEAEFEYEFQGSTTNGTNVKSYSDIDLLCITTRFNYLAPGVQPASPYSGNPARHLKEKRDASADKIDRAFPAAEIDKSGSKSVSVEGGSLTRKVDIVTGAWSDTHEWLRTKEKKYRAVSILDSSTSDNEGWGKLSENMPFLNNSRIEEKDSRCMGLMRKAARLMKTLKYDANPEINVSSYDIVAIAYAMDDALLVACNNDELSLVTTCRDFCSYLITNDSQRNAVEVPDGTRKIFKPDGHTTIQGLRQLWSELNDLSSDIAENAIKSYQRIIESHSIEGRIVNSEDYRPDYSILQNRHIF